MLLWGFNYRRLPLETTLEGGTATTTDRGDARRRRSPRPWRLPAQLRSTAAETMPLNTTWTGADARSADERGARATKPRAARPPGRPKTSRVLTPFFTAAGVDGMVNPFALESIVHPDLLPFERPFVLAHEWAHLAGMADEAEASAIGWLGVHERCAGAGLQREPVSDHGRWRSASRRRLAHARSRNSIRSARRLRSDPARLLRQQPRVRQAITKVYDQYLRANRVEDGTASYGRAVLILRRRCERL